MNEAIIGLTAAYVVLAVLLLNLGFFTRWPVWIKCLCVLAVTGFYFLTYQSLRGMLGWPTRASLPSEFQLLASSVAEPDKTRGTPGIVHLWVNSLESGRPAAEPRAYTLPYSKALHSQLDAARESMRNGVIQLGRRTLQPADEETPADSTRFARRKERLEFFDLPDPQLPEK